MQGRATVLGHPIHPTLVSLPIGSFVVAFVCDIIYVVHPTPFWPIMSLVLLGFGVIGALLAAVFGLLDFLTAPLSRAARTTAVRHLSFALGTVVVFAAAFFIRDADPTSTFGYALTALGILGLGATGALGGHLAYHHRVGVEEADQRAERPAPSGAPSAWSSGKR